MCDSTSPPLTSAQQVSVLVKSGFSGLTWKLVTLPEIPEPALGALTHSSGQGVLPCGPFLLPRTYVMLSDGVFCKKCLPPPPPPDDPLYSYGAACSSDHLLFLCKHSAGSL